MKGGRIEEGSESREEKIQKTQNDKFPISSWGISPFPL